MSTRRKAVVCSTISANRGYAALIVIATILIAGSGGLVYYLSSGARAKAVSDSQTAAALSQAKAALIGWAASASRPGELLCPSNTNLTDGTPAGIATTPCGGHAIGYLPWKTLNLPELRDASGELLWYAVSPAFKNNPAVTPLNSDTIGAFSVSGVTAASNVIAIVFSPGQVLASQSQNRTLLQNALCSTTGTTIPRVRCAANYLEGGNGDSDTNFVSSPSSTITESSSTTFNDKMVLITREDLFPAVEARVAREIRSNLKSYYEINRYLPQAAPLSGSTVCGTGTFPAGNYRGRIPLSCANVTGLTLPTWFSSNNWNQMLIYGVAPRCTPKLVTTLTPDTSVAWTNYGSSQPGMYCEPVTISIFGFPYTYYRCRPYTTSISIDSAALNCNNTAEGQTYLTIAPNNAVKAVIAPSSYTLTGQSSARTLITDYMEPVGSNNENRDSTDNYIYITPTRSSTNNDTLLCLDGSGTSPCISTTP